MKPPQATEARRRGFTLLEALGVLLVAAALAALVVPAVGAALRAGREAEVRAWLRQLALACAAFRQDNRQWPAPTGTAVLDLAADPTAARAFVEALGGPPDETTDYATAFAAAANPRRARYFAFGAEAYSAGPRDPAGGTVALAFDLDGDGLIPAADLPDGQPLRAPVAAWSRPADGGPELRSWTRP